MLMTQNSSESVSSKIGKTLLAMIFLLIGVAVMGLLGYKFYQGTTTYSWMETPCRIISSEIVKPQDSKPDYSYKVKYSYVYNGRSYSATRLSFKDDDYGEYRDMLKLSRFYLPGSYTRCYVSPSNPSEAILIRGMNWRLLLVVIFPTIFILIGKLAINAVWKNENDELLQPPNRYLICAVFGIMLVFSIFFGYYMFLNPALKIWSSANWPKVPCVVESSRVTEHSGSKSGGDTYGIEVIYHYQYQCAAYTGDQYDFNGKCTSTDSDSKAQIVKLYPAGKKTFCYVNPGNPGEAVMSREFRSGLWILGIVPIFFGLLGLFGLAANLYPALGCAFWDIIFKIAAKGKQNKILNR